MAQIYTDNVNPAAMLSIPAKAFLFDRDSTLIDKDEHVINPTQMGANIAAIIATKTPWGIVSTGALDIPSDPAVIALKKTGLDVAHNVPAYQSLGRSPEAIFHIAKDWTGLTEERYVDKNGKQMEDEAHFGGFRAQLVTFGTLNQETGELSGTLNGGQYTLHAKLAENATVTVVMGRSTVTIDLHAWNASVEAHSKGDNKLFQSIKALDELGYCLTVDDKLSALGIIAINSPNGHKPITPAEVVMMDDKEGVGSLMQSAGFHFIHADTLDAAKEKGSYPQEWSGDTYLSKIREEVISSTQWQPSTLKEMETRVLACGRIKINPIEANSALHRVHGLQASLDTLEAALKTNIISGGLTLEAANSIVDATNTLLKCPQHDTLLAFKKASKATPSSIQLLMSDIIGMVQSVIGKWLNIHSLWAKGQSIEKANQNIRELKTQFNDIESRSTHALNSNEASEPRTSQSAEPDHDEAAAIPPPL